MTSATQERSRGAISHLTRWLQMRVIAVGARFRSHGGVYMLSIATYAASLLQGYLLGRPLELGLAGLISTTVLVVSVGAIALLLLADLARLWRSGYPGSPTIVLLKRLFNDILSPGSVANAFHILLATGFFVIGFTNIKANIPLLHPFSWDGELMTLDKELHFGVLPHELLEPLITQPMAVLFVNVAYNVWFLLLMSFIIWQGFRERDTPLRQQFLMAYLVSWILGTALLGTIFSSAGPCFYGRLLPGPDPYAGLMSQLKQAAEVYPVWALSTQDMLWDSYANSNGLISGISAMPSMHVATSVIFFLCARAAGIRWLTWFTAIFAITILIGSVMLAWHYAVDGYAGVLIAVLAWWLAGLWVKRNPPVSSRPS